MSLEELFGGKRKDIDKIIEESSDNKSVFELEEQLKEKLEKLKVI